jgi:hypothetical protein
MRSSGSKRERALGVARSMRLKGPRGDAAESLKRGKRSRIRAAPTVSPSVRAVTLRNPWRGARLARRSRSLALWALVQRLMSAQCSSSGCASECAQSAGALRRTQHFSRCPPSLRSGGHAREQWRTRLERAGARLCRTCSISKRARSPSGLVINPEARAAPTNAATCGVCPVSCLRTRSGRRRFRGR